MNAKTVASMILAFLPAAKELDLSRTYGFIHKQAAAKVNGVEGLLIWDFILYNEITFQDMDKKHIFSLYTSFSNKDTEERWNELVKEYGV